MLRFNSKTGKYMPYGNRTVRPQLGSDEMKEAHQQTVRGQLMALGMEVRPMKEVLDYQQYDYLKPKETEETPAS